MLMCLLASTALESYIRDRFSHGVEEREGTRQIKGSSSRTARLSSVVSIQYPVRVTHEEYTHFPKLTRTNECIALAELSIIRL